MRIHRDRRATPQCAERRPPPSAYCFSAAIASFESRVLVSARKFKDLGATSREAEIIELRAVEHGLAHIDLKLLGLLVRRRACRGCRSPGP